MFARCRRLWAPLPPSGDDIIAAFKVLGIPYHPRLPGARGGATLAPSIEDVRRQYRELARLHHPDLSSGDDNRMKVINTAYELIQSSGVLQRGMDQASTGGAAGPSPSPSASDFTGEGGSRFVRKAGTRRRRVPDDFANGDDMSWSMKSSLDWQSMINNVDTLTEEELKNPANHPFSHSRFFSFDDDAAIYRMLRGGATVPQVARTLGKPATFVEKRLHNAQFKMRVQYLLRGEKRVMQGAPSHSKAGRSAPISQQPTVSSPAAANTTESALRRSPFGESSDRTFRSPGRSTFAAATHAFTLSAEGARKKEWEATYPAWRAPTSQATRSLEEKGRRAKLLREDTDDSGIGMDGMTKGATRYSAASKVGRSYDNYKRLRPKR